MADPISTPPPTFSLIGRPSKEEAFQFATILSVGVPSIDAIQYFLTEEEKTDPTLVDRVHRHFLQSGRVARAQTEIMGKPWQDMSLEERIKFSIDKHYGELAYFLYSHNYSQVSGVELTKANTCRQVLEAKLAGLAGTTDPLTRFYEDMRAGKFGYLAPKIAEA